TSTTVTVARMLTTQQRMSEAGSKGRRRGVRAGSLRDSATWGRHDRGGGSRATLSLPEGGSGLLPCSHRLVAARRESMRRTGRRRYRPDVAGAPLLHGFAEALPERDRAALLARGRQRRYRQNTRVFPQGDSSDFVLVIVDGTVKIVVTTEQGDESLLGVRGPGDVIGELAALDSEPRLASVVALEPVTAHVVTAEEFRSFIAERPKAAVELMRMLIGRLREADRRRVEFGSYDATTRVARLLVELADGLTADEHAALQVPLSQHEIGELVGTSRESVARALAVLRDRDLVSTGHRSIRILQLDALRSFHA